MKSRTTIQISHRTSSIKSSDKIILLQNGVNKEEGTSLDLMSDSSKF